MSVERDEQLELTPSTAPFPDPDLSTLTQPKNALFQGFQRTANFGAGVATVGPGENINTALQLMSKNGGGTVFLRKGTYTLTEDLRIPSGVTLEGVSSANVIIDCNTLYSVRIEGENQYTTGTITATDGDATVTGSGTSWTSAMAGQKILIDGYHYEIASVTDSTHLELTSAYSGDGVSDTAYSISNIVERVTLRTVTIYNSLGSGLVVNAAENIVLDDIYVSDCATNIDYDYVLYTKLIVSSWNATTALDFYHVHGWQINYSSFTDSTTGVVMEQSSSATFIDSLLGFNTGTGLKLTDCANIAFMSNDISNNGGIGIELVSGNTDLQFIAASSISNGSDGYRLTGTDDRISISTTSITDNAGYGINIAASTCDNNYIVAPSFANNALGDINDSGTNTTVISNFGTNAIEVPIYQPIDGSSTPVAVMLASDGTALIADANDADLDEFCGFITRDYSSQQPAEFLNSAKNTNSSFSYTCNAGVDRVILVWVRHMGSGTGASSPTSVTWSSISGTKIIDEQMDQNHFSAWVIVAGTSATNQSATLTVSGGLAPGGAAIIPVTYMGVDQTTPTGTPQINEVGGAGTTVADSITPTQPYSVIAIGAAAAAGSSALSSSDATVSTHETEASVGSGAVGSAETTGFTSVSITHTVGSSGQIRLIALVELMHSTSTQATVVISGKIGGFSGLTPGAPYYLSNTAGAIASSPGSTSLKVGKALSATEIVIMQP